MTDGDALLAEIIRTPDEDAPRLVYADWLTENGQEERAEFIRASIRLSLTHPGYEWGYGSPPGANGSDVRTMFDYAGKGVFASLMNAVPAPAYWTFAHNLKVVRGFAEGVTCTAADWLTHADAMFWHPGQTVECPEVKWQVARGVVDPDTLRRRKQDRYKDCGPCAPWCKGGCSGTGRVPRPCPPTAHPITAVTFSTSPWGEEWWDRGAMLPPGDNPTGFRHDRWPGVAFTLPPAQPLRFTFNYLASTAFAELAGAATGRVNSEAYSGFGPREVQLVAIRSEPALASTPGGAWTVQAEFATRPFTHPPTGEADFNAILNAPEILNRRSGGV